MARAYRIRGSNQYLIWALVLLALGLWCVRDGWFTPERIKQEKTPQELKNFVLFNKSLAVILLTASGVCAYIHRVAR